jgi:hypothetical protein
MNGHDVHVAPVRKFNISYHFCHTVIIVTPFFFFLATETANLENTQQKLDETSITLCPETVS